MSEANDPRRPADPDKPPLRQGEVLGALALASGLVTLLLLLGINAAPAVWIIILGAFAYGHWRRRAWLVLIVVVVFVLRAVAAGQYRLGPPPGWVEALGVMLHAALHLRYVTAHEPLAEPTAAVRSRWPLTGLVRPTPPAAGPTTANRPVDGPWRRALVVTVCLLPLWLLIGAGLWWAAPYDPAVAKRLNARESLAYLIALVWLLGVCAIVLYAVVAAVALRQRSPEEARLELVETVYGELRPDLARAGRWLAASRRRT